MRNLSPFHFATLYGKKAFACEISIWIYFFVCGPPSGLHFLGCLFANFLMKINLNLARVDCGLINQNLLRRILVEIFGERSNIFFIGGNAKIWKRFFFYFNLIFFLRNLIKNWIKKLKILKLKFINSSL